jgi:hypothetical protein
MFKNIEIRACADINPSAAETRAVEYGVSVVRVFGTECALE